MLQIIIFLILGFVLLYFGSDWLVRGGCEIAARLRISQLIIGLTIVAFGTSSPELTVSLKAALIGKGDVSVGNVVGSNIVNILFILGLAAVINPIKIQIQLLKFDLLVCIAASLILWAFMYDHAIYRIEGLILLSIFIWYLMSLKKIAEKGKNIQKELEMPHITEEEALKIPLYKSIAFLVIGLAGLTAGAHFFVEGAVSFAKRMNVSDAVIGLTIVAIGTSLPELATSVMSAIKKKHDISVGNIIGSNIFNICCILGIVFTIRPIEVRGISNVDVYTMIGAAVIMFPIMWTGRMITRLEGAMMLALYIGYIAYLWPK